MIPNSSRIIPLLLGVSALGLFVTIKNAHNRKRDVRLLSVTPSPLKTFLPTQSEAQISRLAYSPSYFPGARDVDTPFGCIRVYEFGPENGQKILLVHGISTPCISLGGLANELVAKGCRVMLFDLFGRGYSDNPSEHEHTEQLYIAQILAVLVSSPLSWTHDNAFYFVGYSLGGGISASFTRYFPEMVASLVLIAPSGLVREKHIAWQSYLLYRTQGILPEWLVKYLLRRRLHNPQVQMQTASQEFGLEDAVAAEIGDQETTTIGRVMDSAVQWQLDHHAGFIDAFISSIRHAPITNQHETFRKIGSNLSQQHKVTQNGNSPRGMVGGKVLLVLGRADPIILVDEMERDVKETIGPDHVHSIVLDAGHDVPISRPAELADELWKVWSSHL